jgi:hypothetical protein
MGLHIFCESISLRVSQQHINSIKHDASKIKQSVDALLDIEIFVAKSLEDHILVILSNETNIKKSAFFIYLQFVKNVLIGEDGME